MNHLRHQKYKKKQLKYNTLEIEREIRTKELRK